MLRAVAACAVACAQNMDAERLEILQEAIFECEREVTDCKSCHLPVFRDNVIVIKCKCNPKCDVVLFCQQTSKCIVVDMNDECGSCDVCGNHIFWDHSDTMNHCCECFNLCCDACNNVCDYCNRNVCKNHAELCPDCYDMHCSFNCFEKHFCE
jgi:hypothetical protein